MKFKWRPLTLFLIILFFIASLYGLIALQRNKLMHRMQDDRFTIKTIIQTGLQKKPLKTPFLAELIGLSIDKPLPLELISCVEAEQKLLAFPIIKQATVTKVFPDALSIDYAIREPIAELIDFVNTGIDEEGYLFPIRPFLTPKYLPQIRLGVTPDLVQPIRCEGFQLALSLLAFFSQSPTHLKRIDVSQALEKNLGKREVVIIVETDKGDHHLLRLSPSDLGVALGNYNSLKKTLKPGSHVIDLRLAETAYISEGVL